MQAGQARMARGHEGAQVKRAGEREGVRVASLGDVRILAVERDMKIGQRAEGGRLVRALVVLAGPRDGLGGGAEGVGKATAESQGFGEKNGHGAGGGRGHDQSPQRTSHPRSLLQRLFDLPDSFSVPARPRPRIPEPGRHHGTKEHDLPALDESTGALQRLAGGGHRSLSELQAPDCVLGEGRAVRMLYRLRRPVGLGGDLQGFLEVSELGQREGQPEA